MNTTSADDRPSIELNGLRLSDDQILENERFAVADFDGGDGNPHNGLFLALNYLDVKDLLSVQMVCKSLCCVVRDDPLLWRCIHIGADLCWKMRDDILFRLTQRAQGNLQCLSLFNCKWITDEGLKAVLMCNPRLKRYNNTKMHLYQGSHQDNTSKEKKGMYKLTTKAIYFGKNN